MTDDQLHLASTDTLETDPAAVPATKQPELPTIWRQSTQGLENRKKAQQIVAMKHGMFASVPIICKGRTCPYFQTCWIPESEQQVGERCPIEIAAIMERFDAYCEKLHINPEDDIVDAGIVKEIVDTEVMTLRADSLLAISGNFIEEVVAGVTPKGQEIYKPELHLAAEFKDRLRDRRIKLYSQLNATRKDRREDSQMAQDPSSVAARIIAKVAKYEKQGSIIDVTPTDDSGTET